MTLLMATKVHDSGEKKLFTIRNYFAALVNTLCLQLIMWLYEMGISKIPNNEHFGTWQIMIIICKK